MKNLQILIVCLFIFLLSACTEPRAPIGQMDFPEGSVQHVVLADNIDWKPCPPHLPAGCAITVLEGDPKKPDLFSVRFKVDKGFVMPPHTHPQDERVTVIEGKVSVAFGLDETHETAQHFGPGDYYVNARDEIHTVWADTTTILQITGIGPWKAVFVEE